MRSTVNQLVDLSRSTFNLKIFDLADVDMIGFKTHFMNKKVKYSYRTRAISMSAASLKPPVKILLGRLTVYYLTVKIYE